ncbi:hypothetical protein LINPERHAP1_LOCUS6422 [Linum perenne]
MQKENQMWARRIKGIIFKDIDFLHASKGRKPSWIWASLCDSQVILQMGARKNLVNLASIRLDHDPWIPFMQGFNSPPLSQAEPWLTIGLRRK